MWRATLKGLLAKKLRLVLTALSIVLGVGFMAGVYVLTDTIKQSYNDIADSLGNVGAFRMNHLYPPFNDVRARRAILMAMSQEDYMRAYPPVNGRHRRQNDLFDDI